MDLTCTTCDAPIGPDELVIRSKVVRRPHGERRGYGTTYIPECFDCGLNLDFSTASASDLGRSFRRAGFDSAINWLRDGETTAKDVFLALYRPTRCERCDRPLYLPRMDRRVAPVCHAACQERREYVCATCEEAFEPSRSDAKYCSPACRQRAYRERKTAQPEA